MGTVVSEGAVTVTRNTGTRISVVLVLFIVLVQPVFASPGVAGELLAY